MSEKEIKELKVEYEEVKSTLELAQQLHTNDGFYQYWFEQLSKRENREKTKEQVFEFVNDLYKEVFKVKKGRFSGYTSFLNMVKRIRRAA